MFYGFYLFHKRKRVAQTKQRAGLHGAKFQRNFAPRGLGISPQQASMIASCPACKISEHTEKAHICRGVAAAHLAVRKARIGEICFTGLGTCFAFFVYNGINYLGLQIHS